MLRSISWLLMALAVTVFPAAAQAKKVKIVATLPDLAAIAKEVGGDLTDVEALSAPNQDPHYVDPRPSLIVSLSKADLLIANGLELEHAWLEPLQVSARNQEIIVGGRGFLDASQFVQLLQVPRQKIDRSMGDMHPGGNPHFTFDPRAAATIAEAIGQRLSAINPENAAKFQANAAAFSQQLKKFAAEQTARFAQLPEAKRRVVSYHLSLTYLYDWLGLSEIITVEPKPGIPPDPGHVARVLQTMRAREVKVIAQEEFYPTSVSDKLAGLAPAKLVVLPGGTRFSKGEKYIDHVKQLADLLHDALTKTP